MGERQVASIAFATLLAIAVLFVSSGPAPNEDSWLGLTGLSTVVQVALLMAALIVVVAPLFFGRRPRAISFEPPPRQRRWGALIGLGVVLLMVWLRPDLIDRLRGRFGNAEIVAPGATSTNDDPMPDGPPPPTDAEVVDLLFLLLVAATLVAVLTLVLARRSSIQRTASDESSGTIGIAPEGPAATVQRLAATLRHGGTDPRDRVLAAYEELEFVAESHGIKRAGFETTGEHTHRISTSLDLDAQPFARLVELHARARYSTLPITNADVEQAAAELDRAIRSFVR